MIFEVGKIYDFTEVWSGDSYDFRATVLAAEATLLKLQRDGIEIILNTAASSFSGAREYDESKIPDFVIVMPESFQQND